MANPRKVVDYSEIGVLDATYKIDNSTITFDGTQPNGASSAMIGKAVTLSAASTVALAADGEAVIGRLERVEADGMCVVRKRGYVKLPGGNGASLTLGKKIVGALNASSAKGYIREVNTATAAELGKAIGQIEDAGTTTAVIVFLG